MSVQKQAPVYGVEGKVCWSNLFEIGTDSRYSEPREGPVITLLRGQTDRFYSLRHLRQRIYMQVKLGTIQVIDCKGFGKKTMTHLLDGLLCSC